ncbi:MULTISPECIES: heavy-metal-associated domain-containing protein [Citricoccus]|uniref:Heavy-metal-associated domain-containing protein n=1 Tax=Citricoccus muralis TaxID=169134 RepID=A0ABY8H5I9_9MICC|nr:MULTISPECIES: heavy-metal-associated domain-containing protein [Citricoccus]WBL20100.1 heavy-metal-associated domain-containing protein [Citricoccus sp. NR2]WFP16380.1 heavy-metal-associated domain-containing protein [Citricoccus muralis]
MSTNTTISMTGLTCGHCQQAVTRELSALNGVTDVAVDLVPHGVSTATVTSASPLSQEQLRDAVAEAGYTLA